MPRYFETFTHLKPMTEISEEDARSREWYLEEVPGPPLHYRHYRDGNLYRVIYPEQEPSTATSDYKSRHHDVPMEVYSPVERGEKTRWRVWYFDKSGEMEHILGFEEDPKSPDWRELHYGPDGTLQNWVEYLHDKIGLAEIVTYDPAGNVIKREDAL